MIWIWPFDLSSPLYFSFFSIFFRVCDLPPFLLLATSDLLTWPGFQIWIAYKLVWPFTFFLLLQWPFHLDFRPMTSWHLTPDLWPLIFQGSHSLRSGNESRYGICNNNNNDKIQEEVMASEFSRRGNTKRLNLCIFRSFPGWAQIFFFSLIFQGDCTVALCLFACGHLGLVFACILKFMDDFFSL